MNFVLIDTSAWIEALRRKGDAKIREHVKHFVLEGQAVWNELIITELWNGARGVAEKKMIKALEEDITILSITPEVWQLAFRFAEKARDNGKTIPTTDIIIFACSKYYGASILHCDKHFELLQQF